MISGIVRRGGTKPEVYMSHLTLDGLAMPAVDHLSTMGTPSVEGSS
jgi:hypothetical protein